jgi:putative ABC transport system ATP-binding protein
MLIRATAITRSYGDGVQVVTALQPTDFAARAGEFMLISGPSGSGKSTLLALISGLLTPTRGEVSVLGSDLAGLSPRDFDDFRLRHFGFIFQGFHLLPALTALEQVSILLQRQGVHKLEAHERARAALGDVGLSHRLSSRPAEMSGGEKQRVAIARALAKRPQVIFADEPTSALDSANGGQIAALLRAAADQGGAAVICVTHDLRLQAYASRQVVMEDGVILGDTRVAH